MARIELRSAVLKVDTLSLGEPAVLLDCPRLSYRDQAKKGDVEAVRGNDGKTTSKSRLALNGIFYYGKPRTARSGGSWL